MKATELLRNQHQQVEMLFEQIESAEGKESRGLVEELVTALVGHSFIEREIFYPVAEEALAAAVEVRRSYEEHALVEYMLQKLLKTDPGDPGFHARVSVLRELVQRHVREEEDDLFPRADREMDEERLEEIGEQMEARFEDLRRQDVEALLAGQLRRAMPRTTARRPAKKAAARRGAAQQPARAKRGATQRTTSARGGAATKGGRTTERKKAAAPAREGGRTGATRGGATTTARGGATTRGGATARGGASKATRGGAKGNTRGNGARKGRTSSASR